MSLCTLISPEQRETDLKSGHDEGKMRLRDSVTFSFPPGDTQDLGDGPGEKVLVVSMCGKTPMHSGGAKRIPLHELVGKIIFERAACRCPDLDEAMTLVEGYYDVQEKVVYLCLNGVFDTACLPQVWAREANNLYDEGFLCTWASMKRTYAKAMLFLFLVSHVVIIYHPTPRFDITYITLFQAIEEARQKVQGSVSDILRSVAGIPREWASRGRLCSPRVLFYFHDCPRHLLSQQPSKKHQSNLKYPLVKKLEHSLEDQIYRILRKSRVITNVSANSLFAIPSNQEFVYVQTEEDESISTTFIMDQLLSSIRQVKDGTSRGVSRSQGQASMGTGNHAGGSHISALSVMQQSGSGAPVLLSEALGISFNGRSNLPLPGEKHLFVNFLREHIELGLTKGFDDNVGRHATPGFFEMASFSIWLMAANRVHELIIRKEIQDPKVDLAMDHLSSLLNPDLRFSEARCSKVLPLALSAYQENLPPHYTEDYHETKLFHAETAFMQQARGPACERFVEKLREECDAIWHGGREMCAVLSLRGNQCINPKHRTPLDMESGENHLPVMPHLSQVKLISTCNCGRMQGSRDDPFDLSAANFDFYLILEEACCAPLEKWNFPVFQPSIKDFRAAEVVEDYWCQVQTNGKDAEPQEGARSGTSLDHLSGPVASAETKQALVKGQSGPATAASHTDFQLTLGGADSGDLFTHDDTKFLHQSAGVSEDEVDQGLKSQEDECDREKRKEILAVAEDGERENDNEEEGDVDKNIEEDNVGDINEQEKNMPEVSKEWGDDKKEEEVKVVDLLPEAEETEDKLLKIAGQSSNGEQEVSTTEYLPGMIHSESPPSLLPQFPHWSLVCLGSSSIYSHSSGVHDQPGFWSGSNVLLPWDVPVKIDSKDKWPAIAESLGKKGQYLKAKRGKEPTEFTVKVFVGMEYECPRGHRFMGASPERVLKAGSAASGKDSALKVVNNDMPLYMSCPCRSGMQGQLMRVHLVTPKAPVKVTLNPRVRPAPSPCPTFHPGLSTPIQLSQSSYWILRLPLVYVGPQGPYYPPLEPVKSDYAVLLKDMIGLTEIILDK